MRDARVLRRLPTELLEHGDTLLVAGEARWIIHVLQKLQLRYGLQPIGASRIPGKENQIAILDSRFRPLQVVVEMNRLVVFVNTEEGDVEVIARVGKIVGVATEKCRLKFRRKHQAHIGVFLVSVQVVNFARVESNNVAAQAGRCGAVFFNGAHGGALCVAGVGIGHGRRSGGFHLGSDVVDADEHVQFKVRTFGLVRPGPGVETALHIVGAGRGKLRNAVRAHVMIGKCQTVGRYERT